MEQGGVCPTQFAMHRRALMATAAKCLAIATFVLRILWRARAFELMSPAIKSDQPFPERFTFNGLGCQGQNISPPLSWTNPPEGTKSFALMVHDPDALTGGAGIWHWVIVNIPATASSIEEGAGTADGAKLPPGSRQITNDYAGLINSPGWGGPCPPQGGQTAQLQFHSVCAQGREAELAAERHELASRFRREPQCAGQGQADNNLRPLASSRRCELDSSDEKSGRRMKTHIAVLVAVIGLRRCLPGADGLSE